MSQWLSFWNKATRRLNEPLLQDDSVSAIYIPYGKQRIARGDVIYCVGLEGGGLQLITRLNAASLDDDLEHAESIWADDVEATAVEADFHRAIRDAAITAIRYLHADGTEHRIRRDAERRVLPHAFQGRASIRELTAGVENSTSCCRGSAGGAGNRTADSASRFADPARFLVR